MNPDTDLEKIAQFDAATSGAYRPGFWAQFNEGRTNYVAVLVVESGGEILGLGAHRSLTNSTRVGPIYAKSAAIAEAVLLKYVCTYLYTDFHFSHVMSSIRVHITDSYS